MRNKLMELNIMPKIEKREMYLCPNGNHYPTREVALLSIFSQVLIYTEESYVPHERHQEWYAMINHILGNDEQPEESTAKPAAEDPQPKPMKFNWDAVLCENRDDNTNVFVNMIEAIGSEVVKTTISEKMWDDLDSKVSFATFKKWLMQQRPNWEFPPTLSGNLVVYAVDRSLEQKSKPSPIYWEEVCNISTLTECGREIIREINKLNDPDEVVTSVNIPIQDYHKTKFVVNALAFVEWLQKVKPDWDVKLNELSRQITIHNYSAGSVKSEKDRLRWENVYIKTNDFDELELQRRIDILDNSVEGTPLSIFEREVKESGLTISIFTFFNWLTEQRPKWYITLNSDREIHIIKKA